MIPQNWNSFGPVEGEDDLTVEQIEAVAQTLMPRLQETIWFGSKPTPAFRLKLDGEEDVA